jgi:hypothetical protein
MIAISFGAAVAGRAPIATVTPRGALGGKAGERHAAWRRGPKAKFRGSHRPGGGIGFGGGGGGGLGCLLPLVAAASGSSAWSSCCSAIAR